MSDDVEVTLSEDDDTLTIAWDGIFNGVCCGPEETALKEELLALGVELTFEGAQCHLPQKQYQEALQQNICIKPDKET